MTHSWTEVQALGVKAASGAGVPPAQALAFGAMLARHLADDGSESPVVDVLNTPETIVLLALRVEEVIEAATVTLQPVRITETDAGQRALLVSWLSGLPCKTELSVKGPTITATLRSFAPSLRSRPARVPLSVALKAQLTELAAKTYVPDSDASRAAGAGAGLLDLD